VPEPIITYKDTWVDVPLELLVLLLVGAPFADSWAWKALARRNEKRESA
jgi:hypothetical protein